MTWTYKEWDKKIHENFENKFFVGEGDSADIDKNLVHKRNIYKDSYKSTNGFTDYQLRPNVPIAMCVVGLSVDFHLHVFIYLKYSVPYFLINFVAVRSIALIFCNYVTTVESTVLTVRYTGICSRKKS